MSSIKVVQILLSLLILVNSLNGQINDENIMTTTNVDENDLDASKEEANVVQSAASSAGADARIFFDMPDLTLSYVFGNSQYQLEAYKSAENDKIFEAKNETKYSQLLWVSMGHPRLVKTLTLKSLGEPRLFHFTHERFYTFVSMVTDDIRNILAAKAVEKYKVNISFEQIVLMPMSEFNCRLKMDSKEGRKIVFNGKVTNLKTTPLQLDFWIPASVRINNII
jgi:hypothetical protein